MVSSGIGKAVLGILPRMVKVVLAARSDAKVISDEMTSAGYDVLAQSDVSIEQDCQHETETISKFKKLIF